MLWVYLHLALNHFPVILTLVGSGAGVVGAVRRSDEAWRYGLVSLAIGAISSLPSWITGYQAHYALENTRRVAEGVVEPHELSAEATMWILVPMGALAAFTWWRRREEPRRGPSPPWLRPAALTAAILGSVMLGVTAFLGGKVAFSNQFQPLSGADSAARAQQSFQLIPIDSLRETKSPSPK